MKAEKEKSRPLLTPEPTHSGFLTVSETYGSEMFYMFYEAQDPDLDKQEVPILLWLQGGPGCSSLFGMLYINGPYFVNEEDLTLKRNLGSWNRKYGMLFIDQPLGVGFSRPGKQHIPNNELDLATDLYKGIQSFYRHHASYQSRKLVVTGESYAGKYVPSISHYILQATARAGGWEGRVKHARNLPVDLEAPLFELGGMAVGNGWTDAEVQTLTTAETAWNMGLIDLAQRRELEVMQRQAVDLMLAHKYSQARNMSDAINAYVRSASGAAVLEDVRRNLGYDGNDGTQKFMNQAHVKDAIGAPQEVTWEACSAEVDRIMGQDIMKSVRVLVIDLLKVYPALFYQGQFDAECGVASNDAWITNLKWPGHLDYMKAPRQHWILNNKVAGYWKSHAMLSVVVVRNAGHMVPHDNPLVGQVMIEKWVDEQVIGMKYKRVLTPDMEVEYANPDQGQDTCCQPDLGPGELPPSKPASAASAPAVDSKGNVHDRHDDATSDYAGGRSL